MEIILRDHVDNVGKRGDVVKVADGAYDLDDVVFPTRSRADMPAIVAQRAFICVILKNIGVNSTNCGAKKISRPYRHQP